MWNVGWVKFPRFTDRYGNLIPIESGRTIPFDIKRIYYIYGVEIERHRGFHSHNELHQILIAVNGAVKIKVQNGEESDVYILNDPQTGLYIGPKVWREMYDFSQDAVLLVLASEHYTEDDYIRNYDRYIESVERYI